MLNIVTVRAGAGAPPEVMSLATFEQVMAALAVSHDRRVILHACPAEAQPHLSDMVNRLLARGMYVEVYLGDGPVGLLDGKPTAVIYDARAVLALRGEKGKSGRAASVRHPEGDRRERAGLFLALPTPEIDQAGLRRLADATDRLDSVILGVGWRSWTTGPGRILPECYSAWAARLLEMVSWLTERGLMTSFACGVPLCLFSRRQLGRLAALKVRWPIAWCDPQYYVEPTGTVRHCARLGCPGGVHISEERPWEKLTARLAPWLSLKAFCGPGQGGSPIAKSRDGEPVSACRSFAARACGGGCLSHSLADWQGPALGRQNSVMDLQENTGVKADSRDCHP